MNISELENFEHRHLIYCKVVKTYVDISLCLQGGPMKAAGNCEYFVRLEKSEKGGAPVLVHAVPTAEIVVKAIISDHADCFSEDGTLSIIGKA